MTSSRPSWDEVWMHVAGAVAGRSLCTRAHVGAVIVDAQNRIVATGYNGPPRGFVHHDEPCDKWCSRSQGVNYHWKFGHGVSSSVHIFAGGPLDPNEAELQAAGYEKVIELKADYSDCPALHAEANALSVCDRSTREGGTIYVLGDVCFNCAKLIANSGLATVVVMADGEDRSYRQSHRSYAFLEDCGIEVITHEVGGTTHR